MPFSDSYMSAVFDLAIEIIFLNALLSDWMTVTKCTLLTHADSYVKALPGLASRHSEAPIGFSV